MSELKVTPEQIHERVLLVALTVLLAVAAAMPWAREGNDEYTGWGLITQLGSSPEEEDWSFAAIPPALAIAIILMLAVLVGVVLAPPAEITGGFGKVLGSLAIVLGLVLLLLATGIGRNDRVDVGGGMVVAGFLSFGLATLYFRTAASPWPRQEPRPTVRRKL